EGVPVTAIVTLARADSSYFLTGQATRLLTLRVIMLVTLLFGVAIAWIRPRDSAALIGGLLLASAGVFSISLPNGIATVWRALPGFAGWTLWLPFLCANGIGAIAF